MIRISKIKTALLAAALALVMTGGVSARTPVHSPLPVSSRQMLVVVTDSAGATAGTLFRWERESSGKSWVLTGRAIAVSIGRNGLGWGRGLQPPRMGGLPLKAEGDGRSPAGIFPLGPVFGFPPPEKMTGLEMPYIQLTALTECVDDPASVYYNSIVRKDTVARTDWRSSEKMGKPGIWYQLGVFVGHNKNPVRKSAGSCIFLHNWSEPGETTSGCTAMAPSDLRTVVFWLNAEKQPVLVQLTRPLYRRLRRAWALPPLPGRESTLMGINEADGRETTDSK